MIKKSKQVNKGTVKNQTNKADTKKKVVNKVWECIVCSHRIISDEKPIKCVCSNDGNYAINNTYTVGE